MAALSLFSSDRPPILLIGSGISKRYLSGYPAWEEMLQNVAERIGLKNRQFAAFKSHSKGNGDYGDMPHLATDLENHLLTSIMDGRIIPEDVYPDSIGLEQYDAGINPLKILIASNFAKYSISDDEHICEELDSFKKLTNVVPAVITTNYDRFLENEIFKDYYVYSRVSDYYFSDSEGIGEIFKIHGTVDTPDSLIVTDKDYSQYISNSKIITAKILSLLCDYPLLIMGYSLDDVDVKQIISDLIESLDDEKLKSVEDNILFVDYSPEADGFEFSKRTFDINNRKLTLRTISARDFKPIYDKISEIVPTVSSTQIRRYRQLVKNIAITSNPSQQQMLCVGAVDFNNKDMKNVVLIAANSTQVSKIIAEFLNCDRLVRDILFDGIVLDPKTVLDSFEDVRLFKLTEYVPLYPYIAKYPEYKMTSRVRNYCLQKKTQYPLHRIDEEGISANITDLAQLNDLKPYRIPMILVYLVRQGKLTSEAALNELKVRYDLFNEDPNSRSRLKMAVCYLTSLMFPIDEREKQDSAGA